MKSKISAILALVMCLSLSTQALAFSSEPSNNSNSQGPVATITARHLSTGEMDSISIPVSSFSLISCSTNDDGEQERTVGCEVFVEIEDGGISLLDTEGASKEKGGVTAYLSVTYTISSDLSLIKVSEFSGGWTFTSSLYYLTDKDVGVHTGTSFNTNVLRESPEGDTFHYVTGWDYAYRAPNGDTQARAWSEAVVWVGGMEHVGGVDLILDFPFATIGQE